MPVVFHSQDPSHFIFEKFYRIKIFTVFYLDNGIGKETMTFNQIKFNAKE